MKSLKFKKLERNSLKLKWSGKKELQNIAIRNIIGNQIQIFKPTNFLYYLDGKALSSHSSARTCANFAFILHYLNELWIGSTRILARVKTDHDCGISYSFFRLMHSFINCTKIWQSIFFKLYKLFWNQRKEGIQCNFQWIKYKSKLCCACCCFKNQL